MNNLKSLREDVRQTYSVIADRPHDAAPFPTGRALAIALGYPTDLLDTLPIASVEAFCGISNVSMFAEVPSGATVLDLGAGAGLDTLLAARRTGAKGRVIAIDFSEAMLARVRQAAVEAQFTNVETCRADAETLPLADESIDVALVNGIFNLNPFRESVFSELARVVKPGGSVYAAELVLAAPMGVEDPTGTDDWFT